MFAWLRRHQPRNVGLAVLYWTGLTLAGFVVLFLLFYYVVDPLLPAMF
jgi:hypothetical protein